MRKYHRISIPIFLGFAVLVLTAQSQPSLTLDRRVTELERRVETLELLVAQSRAAPGARITALYPFIKKGMQPREVVALLGEPSQRYTFIWYYPAAKSGGKLFYVEFRGGVVHQTPYVW